VNDDRLLTAEEAAELLNVKVSWIRDKTREGALPHVELGRFRRYRRDSLLAWIEAQERALPPNVVPLRKREPVSSRRAQKELAH
jgi:excisionase family DNA binding protein